LALLIEDKSDLLVLGVYTVIIGVLGLATPLTVQALVNSIAYGTVQPLIVLAFLMFLGLLAAGGLSLLQLSLIEAIQQRLFARLALRIARKIILSTSRAVSGVYTPELANRFFDVLTVQKSLAKLLLDGLTAVLQALVGLIILSFYDHGGLLVGFDLLILLFVGFIIFPLGIGGLKTSLAESAEKYKVAGWLEDLARCRGSFKVHAAPLFLFERAEKRVKGWLYERRKHFSVTIRQEAGNQLFQAFASAGVLAIGGYLVVQQEILLGQLVAAQLIVGQVLKAIDKLVRQSETFYDLLTGLDKTGYLTDLETETEGGVLLPDSDIRGAAVTLHEVRFSYGTGQEVLRGLDITLQPGERVSLVGASGAGKSTIAALLVGLETPTHGLIAINGIELSGVDKNHLRQMVSVVGYDEAIFEGTMEENIRVGRTHLTPEEIATALRIAQLEGDIMAMPNGLQTQLLSGGSNLSRGQIQRVLIARAIVDEPDLLILDEAFTAVDERTTLAILDALFDIENNWTIIDISHDGSVVTRADKLHVLSEGIIVESGSPKALSQNPNGAFSTLFPELSRTLAGRSVRKR
jgi:ABC-type bacteriocin/lantibiotic exporter with double-glycine peptidase domain